QPWAWAERASGAGWFRWRSAPLRPGAGTADLAAGAWAGKAERSGEAAPPHRPRPYPGAMQRPIRRSPTRLGRIRLSPLLAALAALLVLSSCSHIKEQAGDVVEHAIEDAVTGLDLTDGVP